MNSDFDITEIYDLADDDLAEVIESGEATNDHLAEAILRANRIDHETPLHVAPFEGDYEETRVLKDKMVVARKPHCDHWSGFVIGLNEVHRVITERTEDGSPRRRVRSRMAVERRRDRDLLCRK